MNEKRRGLGRGLGALIPTTVSAPKTAEPPVDSNNRPVDVFFPSSHNADSGVTETTNNTRTTSLLGEGQGHKGELSEAVAKLRSSSAGLRNSKTKSGTSKRKSVPTLASSGTNTAAASLPPVIEETPVSPATPTTEQVATISTGAVASIPQDSPELVNVPGLRFAELEVTQIKPNPKQPRTVFDEEELAELVDSIQEVGLLQPIVVRQVATDQYELIMGERRWRATQEVGLKTIPAIIRQTEDGDLLRDALLENLHRSNLNPLEEAAAYNQLLEDFGCTHEELATRIARSRPQISNTLRLLKLPPLVQRRVAAGVLSAGHSRAILGLDDPAAMERLAQRVVAEGLSVRATEEIVAISRKDLTPTRTPARTVPHRSEAMNEIAGRLSDKLDTRVKVDMGKRKGKLTVEFATVEDLQRILQVISPHEASLLKEQVTEN